MNNNSFLHGAYIPLESSNNKQLNGGDTVTKIQEVCLEDQVTLAGHGELGLESPLDLEQSETTLR